MALGNRLLPLWGTREQSLAEGPTTKRTPCPTGRISKWCIVRQGITVEEETGSSGATACSTDAQKLPRLVVPKPLISNSSWILSIKWNGLDPSLEISALRPHRTNRIVGVDEMKQGKNLFGISLRQGGEQKFRQTNPHRVTENYNNFLLFSFPELHATPFRARDGEGQITFHGTAPWNIHCNRADRGSAGLVPLELLYRVTVAVRIENFCQAFLSFVWFLSLPRSLGPHYSRRIKFIFTWSPSKRISNHRTWIARLAGDLLRPPPIPYLLAMRVGNLQCYCP